MLNRDNVVGIAAIKFIGNNQVASMPLLNVNKSETVGPVVLSQGEWYDLDFEPDTAVMSITSRYEAGHLVWTVSVRVRQAIFDEYADPPGRALLDVTDKNGRRYLVGTKDEPLPLNTDESTGAKAGDFGGMDIVLEGRLMNKPPIYNP
jgi:hypothetical protein